MEQNELLVSMARYIHAVYDININVSDPNLNITLKKYVEKLDGKDETLQSYWDGYVAVLSGKTVIQKDSEPGTIQTQQLGEKEASTKTITYRGQTIEVKKDNTDKKQGIMYRGKKL